MRAVVVGNGEKPSQALWNRLMRGNPVVLCADGGADTAYGYGVVPHAVIGDLDSLSSDARAEVSPEHLVCIDADNTGTDVQKVLRWIWAFEKLTWLVSPAGEPITGCGT